MAVLGPSMPRALWLSLEGWRFLVSEVPLYFTGVRGAVWLSPSTVGHGMKRI
jgi:hypothetical protein